MDDSYEAVVATFAVLKAGAVAVPIDADSSAAEVGAMLRRAAAVAFIVEARLASAAAAAMSSWTSVRLVLLRGGDPATSTPCCLVFEEIASGIGAAPQIDRPGPASDPALRMRAVADPADAVLTHADVIAAAGSSGERTRHLSAILSFQGMCGIVAAVRAGATLVLETPSVFRRALSAHADNDAVPALAG
jgi:acyl-CoA synthetase (AMP-forming)/AMP-acid ligase II